MGNFLYLPKLKVAHLKLVAFQNKFSSVHDEYKSANHQLTDSNTSSILRSKIDKSCEMIYIANHLPSRVTSLHGSTSLHLTLTVLVTTIDALQHFETG